MVENGLIEKLKKNDRNAFKQLFYIYSKRVYGTAYMILKDKSYVEDIVQETFMKVYERIDTLKETSAFETWLYRITVNSCYKFIKFKEKHAEVSIEENDVLIEDVPDSDVPEEILMQKEFRAEIISCIYKLPPYQRIAVTLFYYNEMSINEIAGIMDCSINTVKSRLHQGKNSLRKLIINEPPERKNKNAMGGVIYENR